MAVNFLIALATALGSATLMLLGLRLVLKVFAPDSFNEVLSLSEPVVERQTSQTASFPGVKERVAHVFKHISILMPYPVKERVVRLLEPISILVFDALFAGIGYLIIHQTELLPESHSKFFEAAREVSSVVFLLLYLTWIVFDLSDLLRRR